MSPPYSRGLGTFPAFGMIPWDDSLFFPGCWQTMGPEGAAPRSRIRMNSGIWDEFSKRCRGFADGEEGFGNSQLGILLSTASNPRNSSPAALQDPLGVDG